MPIICCKNNVYMVFEDSAEADNAVDFDEIFDRHFEVDELLVLPVIELNKRGYITVYSCSGHPFMWELTYQNDEEEQQYENPLFYEKDEHLYFYAYRRSIAEAYIKFEQEYKFKILPDGWRYERDTLRFAFSTDLSDYELHKVLIKAMDSLYAWACSLNFINGKSNMQ